IYLMMNKPQGYISATKDYNDTVLDLLDEKFQNKDIFPVGRLDKDTEGLLILTNDGKLAHELLSPKKKVDKKYYAKVDNILSEEDIDKFKDGIYLEKEQYLTMPAKLEIISNYECYVYIKEGKYHQVKRMLKSCGKEVLYLKRISMGNINLDETLDLGQYRELTEKEIEILKNN
ncbi:16S rRNA pseudouridine(516) synthase, partial [Helcococcus ovis]